MSLSKQYGRLISLSLPCPEVSTAKFLHAAKGQPRFFMQYGREGMAFAGMGTALEVMEWGADRFEKVQRRTTELFTDALIINEVDAPAAPRLFGGFAFRDEFLPDNAWADFTPAHFVLPHYQFVSTGHEAWLTLNAHIPYGENPYSIAPDLKEALQAKIQELQETSLTEPVQVPFKDLHYPMPYETWAKNINDATAKMRAGDFDKIVLSRVAELQFEQPVNIDAVLAYLEEQYADTCRFLFEPRPGRAFYGATPELIAGVQGEFFRTMALAGSIARGKTPSEDEAFAQELLNSKKDRYEHQIVVDSLQKRLSSVLKEIHIGETGILTLSNIQHIQTSVTGLLKEANGVTPVLSTLHPTPALGGSPREIAVPLIGNYEPVPRGWYAAPVGWIDAQLDGEFFVAIRSAVAQAKRVWLYAGAGIVADSEPQKEWDETALKFRPMLNAHGVG